jgi:uncharacterized membrane protein
MKQYIIALVALLTLTLAIVPSALAMTVTVNDASSEPLSVGIGETLNIKVAENPSVNYSDVVITASLTYNGKKVDVESKAFDMMAGTNYVRNLQLKVPENIKTTSPGENYVLGVRMNDNKGREIAWTEFDVTVSRENDAVEIQKVITTFAKAGEPVLTTIVVKNIGSDNLDDVYVKVSIPQLGISTEERLGDIASIDSGEDEDVATADVPLRIPQDAESGTYALQVEVYNDNDDVQVSATKDIVIDGVAPAEKFVEVVPTLVSQDIGQGETATYSLRVANLGDSAKTFTVFIEGTDGWATYQINPLVVTLAPESGQTITVAVTVANNALMGEHKFTAKVKSDDAVKSIALTANVKEKTVGVDALLISVIVLAVVLVILIAILVKTRKASDESIEAEESYY